MSDERRRRSCRRRTAAERSGTILLGILLLVGGCAPAVTRTFPRDAVPFVGTAPPFAEALYRPGGQDDESPSAPCVQIGERLRASGRPVAWKVYPNATHAFDVAEFGTRTVVSNAGARGVFVYRHDPEATADAAREVTAFFARHLGSGRGPLGSGRGPLGFLGR